MLLDSSVHPLTILCNFFALGILLRFGSLYADWFVRQMKSLIQLLRKNKPD